MIDFKYIANIIKEHNTFLITTHVNPDADAIGSEMAFYLTLKALGKKAYIINYSETPSNLKFLDKDNVIQKFQVELHSNLFSAVDMIVALDFNNPNRTVKMEPYILSSTKPKMCIDHHQFPKDFAQYNFIDESYAATGQILFDLLEATNITGITKDLSDVLYAAIMTDTGSFRFDRTTSRIHNIAAYLLDRGTDPSEIYDRIYDHSRFGKLKLLGKCLTNMTLNENGNIAYMIVTRKELEESGAEESEVDGFVNYCLSVDGARIGLLFFELKDGLKISFRSKGSVPVNKLASEFGGGGHINAAGARLFNVDFYEYINRVITSAEKYLEIY